MGKESKLSFSTNSSPKCKAILPHNFTNPSHSICRKGFVPIMQNLYKSFPTNESLLFLSFSLHFSFYVYFILFFLFIFSISFEVFFFFSKTWNSSPKEKIYSPAFGGNNRRIDTPGPWDHELRALPLSYHACFISKWRQFWHWALNIDKFHLLSQHFHFVFQVKPYVLFSFLL